MLESCSVRVQNQSIRVSDCQSICSQRVRELKNQSVGESECQRVGELESQCNATAGVIVRRAFESEFFVE